MHWIALAVCASIAAPAPPAGDAGAAQQGAPSNSLARVLAAFSAADADQDGRISAQEAHAIPVGPADLAQNDLDGDGAWSRDEFTLYYRRRLVAGGQSVGQDLDAEVARIGALKRVKVIEEARKQSGTEKGEVEPVGVRLEKALSDLERGAVAHKTSPEDFRRLRNLVILSGRSAPEANEGPQAPAGNAQVLQTLERIEKRAASGQYVREDFESLRTLVTARAAPSSGAPTGGESIPPGIRTGAGGPVLGPAEARRRTDGARGTGPAAPRVDPRIPQGKAPPPKPPEKPVPPPSPPPPQGDKDKKGPERSKP